MADSLFGTGTEEELNPPMVASIAALCSSASLIFYSCSFTLMSVAAMAFWYSRTLSDPEEV